jgi:hypothetical protein
MAVFPSLRGVLMALNVRDNLCPSLVIVFGTILGLSSGCGSNSPVITDSKDKAERVQESSLAQLGDVLRIRQEESSPPPVSAADVVKYERAFPLACGRVKSGALVLFYGVPLQEGVEDKVLAYEKQAPDSGGHVLMQDGKTIKKLTAEEFKSAPKAGKG